MKIQTPYATEQHTGDCLSLSAKIPPALPALRGSDGMAVIGRTLASLRGHRFNEGEGGGGPAPAPAPAPAPEPVPAPAPTPNPEVGPDGKPWDPARAGSRISELNAEAKAAREAREIAEQRATDAENKANAILKAAGYNPDGTPYTELDPAKVQAEKSQSDKERDATKRENLVLRIATRPEISANVEKLLDTVSFTSKLNGLAADDSAGVESLVKEYIGKDDSYKVVPAAASSGSAAHTGSTPTDKRPTKEAAIAARYKANAPTPKP